MRVSKWAGVVLVAVAASTTSGCRSLRNTVDAAPLGGLDGVARGHLMTKPEVKRQIGAVVSVEQTASGNSSSAIPIIGRENATQDFTYRVVGETGVRYVVIKFKRRNGGPWRMENFDFLAQTLQDEIEARRAGEKQ